MNLPRLLTIVTTVFGILMFASCRDSENCEKPPTDSAFKKNTYYAVQDTANGWEEGIYYNGTFLMAHANKKKAQLFIILTIRSTIRTRVSYLRLIPRTITS